MRREKARAFLPCASTPPLTKPVSRLSFFSEVPALAPPLFPPRLRTFAELGRDSHGLRALA